MTDLQHSFSAFPHFTHLTNSDRAAAIAELAAIGENSQRDWGFAAGVSPFSHIAPKSISIARKPSTGPVLSGVDSN